MRFSLNPQTAFIIVFLQSCAGTVQIKSFPEEADVYILGGSKEDKTSLGKTPLTKKTSELGDKTNKGPVVLIIEKPGFQAHRYILPILGSGNLSIDVHLSPAAGMLSTTTNKIITMLFQAERYLMENRPDEALKTAEEIKKINGNIAAAYHIAGAAYIMQKDTTKSRFEWARALELDPENNEAQKMLESLDEGQKKQ
jgi:tetratricopeptide (TPR) repeat protein